MLQFDFIGRLHPLIVHVPIGILLFAFAMMLFQRFKRVEMESAIAFALLLGAISAAVSCGAGWILAQSGEYDADLVFKHQWTGIGTAALGFAAYFIPRFRWVLATATVVLLAIAGHYGGTLTHGEDYLFPKKKTPSVKKDSTRQILDSTQIVHNQLITTVTDTSKGVFKKTSMLNGQTASTLNTQVVPTLTPTIQKSFVYQDLIMPILESKCYKCHSATKMKGELRLDSEEFIKAGGEDGSVLIVGNPENSPLYSFLVLPEEDDNHMPPQGKPQPTPEEIALIHAWIKKGAPFQETTETVMVSKTNAVQANTSITKVPKGAVIGNSKPEISISKPEILVAKPKNTEGVQNTEAKILETKTDAANANVLAKLKLQNIIISNFGEGSNYLMANFVNIKNFNSTMIDDLKSLENQLVRVKLSNLPVTDNDVKKLAAFKNITRLNLDKTAITDAGLAHLQNMPNLEQLNLYGTNITDKGLIALAKCPNLKVVYLWQTKATTRGTEQLKKALPNVKVEMGGFQFEKPDTNKVKKAQNTEEGE